MERRPRLSLDAHFRFRPDSWLWFCQRPARVGPSLRRTGSLPPVLQPRRRGRANRHRWSAVAPGVVAEPATMVATGSIRLFGGDLFVRRSLVFRAEFGRKIADVNSTPTVPSAAGLSDHPEALFAPATSRRFCGQFPAIAA